MKMKQDEPWTTTERTSTAARLPGTAFKHRRCRPHTANRGLIMRVLVTGSRGFVGAAFVDRLRAQGHLVMGLSRQPAQDSYLGDLLQLATIKAALKDFSPEVIVNLAGKTALKGAPTGGYAANTVGVSNLVSAIEDCPSVRRVIWMSSQLVARPDAPPKYDTAYDPQDEYGRSKMEGEQIVRHRDGGGREWVIVRSTTIWGPGMSDYYAQLLRLIRRGFYFHIGRRRCLKSFSYIENLTEQLAALTTADSALVHRKTFYLADSEPIDLHRWTSDLAKRLGKRLPTVPEPVAQGVALLGDVAASLGLPAPLTTKRLRNMTANTVYDLSPIEALAGPSRVSIEEGVERTALWFVESTQVSRVAAQPKTK